MKIEGPDKRVGQPIPSQDFSFNQVNKSKEVGDKLVEDIKSKFTDSFEKSSFTADEINGDIISLDDKAGTFSRDLADEISSTSDLVENVVNGEDSGLRIAKISDEEGIVIEATEGEDEITVSQDNNGNLIISNGEDDLTVRASDIRYARGKIAIDLKGGDDYLEIDDSVDYGIKVNGGEGDDILIGGKGHDILIGGEGDDVIEGMEGDDYLEGGYGNDVIHGDEGKDVIYGLDGKDRLFGGDGQDYIDGGEGKDYISGNRGNDVLFGGLDNDIIRGGSGDDVIASGEGIDKISGGWGADKIYHTAGDKFIGSVRNDDINEVDLNTTNIQGAQPGSTISIEGSEEFRKRVESDLNALRSIPIGREMLMALDNSGHQVTIREEKNRGNWAAAINWDKAYAHWGGSPNEGSDVIIGYNRERVVLGNGAEDWMSRPPIVGLFHEMVHAYNFTTGTAIQGNIDGTTYWSPWNSNVEHQAVGLPYDHDNDPSTPLIEPDQLTENKFRDFLGLPHRPRY